METLFKFENVEFIHLVWVLLALTAFSIFLLIQKKNLLKKFTSEKNFEHLAKSVSFTKQAVKLGLTLTGIFVMIFSLMRPVGSPEEQPVKVKGRDIVFVLDVSRSMLAEDEGTGESRLNRAKTAINDLVSSLSGDRVGLVAFAGTTVLKSPLTNDYNFFKSVLKRTTPSDINRGGSLIGDAIRFVDKHVLSTLKEDEIRYQEIILITDGEDQESFPVEASKTVVEKGIRIHTVGIGSLQGSKIPIRNERGQITGYVKQSKEGSTAHTSTLNEKDLKEIALITGGVYIPARTNVFYLDELYNKYIATREQREQESKTVVRWTEMYQLPLIIGLALIVISFFIPTRRRFKMNSKSLTKPHNFINVLTISLLILLCVSSCADKGYQLVEEGNEDLIMDNTAEAKAKYQQAQEQVKDSEVIEYNLAQTNYLEGQFEEAEKTFEKLSNSERAIIKSKAKTGLGNVYMKMADGTAKQQPQQAYQLYTKSIEKYREVLKELKDQVREAIRQRKDAENEAVTKTQLNALLGEDSLIDKVSYNLERSIKKRNELDMPENQEQNQEQNQNQEQEQQDQEQQNQEQQNQEQNQNQEQEQQDQEQNQEQEQQNQEQQNADKPLTAEEAKEMLEKMRNENEEIEEQMKQMIQQGRGVAVEKDW